MNKDTITLPGKIGITLSDSFYIYNCSNKNSCKFPVEGERFSYGGFRWVNNTNNLIGIEYLNNENGTVGGNLVYFNLEGKIVETIYKADFNEIPGHAYLSRKDKRLLFTIDHKGDTRLDPLEGLNREKTLLILDCNSKKIVQRIERIGTSLTFELHESPWLFDENRFVYSLSSDKKFLFDNTSINAMQDEKNGIYIYDLDTEKKTLLVLGGYFAICSPKDLKIGYIKDQSVQVMNLQNKSTEKILEVGLEDRIVNIHWTPDANFIYVSYYKQEGLNKYKKVEKLINIKTKCEVAFKSIGHGFRLYTWK